MTDDDRVGYKRPPKATQFQKGKSGNPQGRPKGTRNLKTDLAEELASRVTITVHGKTAKVSKQKALIMAITNRALKGDMRAAMVVVNLVRQLLDPGAQLDDAIMRPSRADQEIIKSYVERYATNPKGDRQ